MADTGNEQPKLTPEQNAQVHQDVKSFLTPDSMKENPSGALTNPTAETAGAAVPPVPESPISPSPTSLPETYNPPTQNLVQAEPLENNGLASTQTRRDFLTGAAAGAVGAGVAIATGNAEKIVETPQKVIEGGKSFIDHLKGFIAKFTGPKGDVDPNAHLKPQTPLEQEMAKKLSERENSKNEQKPPDITPNIEPPKP